MKRSTVLLFGFSLLAACSKAPSEAAPVAGGETFTYRFTSASVYDSTITIARVDGSTFKMSSNPAGAYEPEELDVALGRGRTQIKAHYLGQLWLPPSARKANAVVLVGTVKPQTVWNAWPVWPVEEAGGRGVRYYHAEQGFLVGMAIAVGGGSFNAQLIGTSISGMGPKR